MINERFRCVCCSGEFDADQASFDDQLGGPVCEDCRKQLRNAEAWLKSEGISRPVSAGDITQFNYKRFSKENGFK